MRRPRLTQEDAAQALGVSRATVQNIERGMRSGRPFTRVNSTMRAYAALLGWTADSAEAVAAGGEPTAARGGAGEPVAEAPAAEAQAAASTGLPLTVAEELASDGALLDTRVIALPGGGHAVVVAKGKPGGTPEEVKQALEAWRRAQPQLQVIDDLVGDEGAEPEA
ncbi:helix-turn-helix transcriptional regulator [Streptomyces sp. NPDC002851]